MSERDDKETRLGKKEEEEEGARLKNTKLERFSKNLLSTVM